ncbi:uncharacterized protein [Dermacentor albipictus]|uniref:uncharacterized protein isoform X2 n=1 Tax=Dermacentor albipictus TaxID=60249 RepID=UPI0031FD60F4
MYRLYALVCCLVCCLTLHFSHARKQLVADGSDAAAEQAVAEGAAAESSCPLPPAVEHNGDDVVVTGSPVPQLTRRAKFRWDAKSRPPAVYSALQAADCPDAAAEQAVAEGAAAESFCPLRLTRRKKFRWDADARPPYRSRDSIMCEEEGGVIYRCGVDGDEEGIDTSRCTIRRVNCPAVIPHGVDMNLRLFLAGQFAKFFCMAAARPRVSGPDNANTPEDLSWFAPKFSDQAFAFYRNSSVAGGSTEDCEALFVSYAISVELSDIFSFGR